LGSIWILWWRELGWWLKPEFRTMPSPIEVGVDPWFMLKQWAASRQKWTMKGSFLSWLVENSPRDPYQWNFKLELSKQSGLYLSLNKSDKSNPCHHYLIPNRRSENSTTEITPNHQPTYQFFFLISWMILWLW
jgi:hypothetical protein